VGKNYQEILIGLHAWIRKSDVLVPDRLDRILFILRIQEFIKNWSTFGEYEHSRSENGGGALETDLKKQNWDFPEKKKVFEQH
jgi:hypothetical protein